MLWVQQSMHNLQKKIIISIELFQVVSQKMNSLLPVKLPSWFSIFTSTRIFHTFSSALMHSDSKSTHRDSFNARSKFRVRRTICSAERLLWPLFTLTYRTPSAGRVACGWVISHDTWAKIFVSPNDTRTHPNSLPNCIENWRNSANSRPSKRCSSDLKLGAR